MANVGKHTIHGCYGSARSNQLGITDFGTMVSHIPVIKPLEFFFAIFYAVLRKITHTHYISSIGATLRPSDKSDQFLS